VKLLPFSVAELQWCPKPGPTLGCGAGCHCRTGTPSYQSRCGRAVPRSVVIHLPVFGSLTRYDTHVGWAPNQSTRPFVHVNALVDRALGVRKVDYATWNAWESEDRPPPTRRDPRQPRRAQYRCQSPPFDITQLLVTGRPGGTPNLDYRHSSHWKDLVAQKYVNSWDSPGSGN